MNLIHKFSNGYKYISTEISIESILKVYAVFCFANLIIHSIGFYTYPIINQFDVLLYLIKIGIVWILKNNLLKRDGWVAKSGKLFKYIIILDSVECFTCLLATDIALKTCIVIVSIVAKCILEYVAIELIIEDAFSEIEIYEEFKAIKVRWLWLNVTIIISTICAACVRITMVLAFVYLMFLLRFAFLLSITKNIGTFILEYRSSVVYEEEIPSKICLSKKIIKNKYVFILCLLLLLICMRFTYVDGDIQLLDDKGNLLNHQTSVKDFYDVSYDVNDIGEEKIYIYTVKNLMPRLSGFYDEKYGLINLDSGVNTGPIFDYSPEFDSTGIAYDYDRHFVDLNGKEVLKVPYIVKAKTSVRQNCLDYLMNTATENDEWRREDIWMMPSEERGMFILSKGDKYFANGVASYHSNYNDRYGFISDRGKMITMPKYRYIEELYGFKATIVVRYNGLFDIVNQKGKSIINEDTKNINIYYNAKMFGYTSANGQNKYVTYDGKKLEGKYNLINKDSDVVCFAKYDDEESDDYTLQVYHGDSELVLSSDLYSGCYSYAENGELNYFVVKAKKTHSYYSDVNEYYLLDKDGKKIFSDSYRAIKCTGEQDVFWGIRKDKHVDILYLDGTIINTNYYYVNRSDDFSQLCICEDIGPHTYNYINIKGELVSDWFEDDDIYIDDPDESLI